MSRTFVSSRPGVARISITTTWSEVVLTSGALDGCGVKRVAVSFVGTDGYITWDGVGGDDPSGDYIQVGQGEHYAWHVHGCRPHQFWLACTDAAETPIATVHVSDGPTCSCCAG